MEKFEIMSLEHILALGIVGLVCIMTGKLGILVRDGSIQHESIKKTLGYFVLLNIIFVYIYQIIINFKLESSIPLQFCDWAWIIACICLFTQKKTLLHILFFWGLTFNALALATPVTPNGFPSSRFIIFWLCHGGITSITIYTIFAFNHIPSPKDAIKVWAISLIGMLVVMSVNFLLGTNYMFINGKPQAKTPLDWLCDWPYYIIQELIIFLILWVSISFAAHKLKGKKL